MNVEEENKAKAVAFYDLMFNKCQPREAIEQFVGEEYIQHNPDVADGKDGFIAYFERMNEEYPGKKVEFKKVIGDGHYVVLHCHQKWPGDKEYAGIDIFDSTLKVRSSNTGTFCKLYLKVLKTIIRCSEA